MKRLTLALVASVLALIAVVPIKAAQCPTCFVAAWVDVPAYGQTTPMQIDSLYAAGWAFQCYNGESATRFSVLALQNGVPFSLPVLSVTRHARPDVSAMAVAAGCANPATPGFTITLGSGYGGASLQPGPALISVTAWYYDTPSQGQVRSILAVAAPGGRP